MIDQQVDTRLILTALLSAQLITTSISSAKIYLTMWPSVGINTASDVLIKLDVDPQIIYVPANFSKIQEAINAANPGDTVYVSNGTYYENIIVNKKDLRLLGEYKGNTIIDGSGTGTVVYVVEPNVTVDGFTIRNSGTETGDSGIFLYSSDCCLKNNIIENCTSGIQLGNSHRNYIVDNIIQNNIYAIYLRLSWNNTFKDNIIQNNTCGICLRDQSNNNCLYHNGFINNTKQVEMLGVISKNCWNATWPSGGNYWSDYLGVDEKSGPNQDLPGGDGMGDTPYNVIDEEKDYHPRLLTVHNVDTGLHYFLIQKAVDAEETRDNHTIKVDRSICYENVRVYKSLTLQGENETTTIIDGGGSGKVLFVTAVNVKISNFTLRNGRYGLHIDKCGGAVLRNIRIANNSYSFLVSGTELPHFINDVDDSNWVDDKRIYYLVNKQDLLIDGSTYADLGFLGLISCTNITVQNLNLTRNGQGLLLASTNSSTITHVTASNNGYGFYLFDCSGNSIDGNNITSNDNGVKLLGCHGNNITNNNIRDGIYLSGSGNIIANNNITDSLNGICLVDSFGNNIINNTIAKNVYNLWLGSSNNNSITGNNLTDSECGIYCDESSDNNVTNNRIINNNYGISLYLSTRNRIFHNYFDNKIKDALMVEPGQLNYWHDGYPRGGNYWHKFRSSAVDEKRGAKGFPGVPQPLPGSDGINDTSYYVDSVNVDWYPLTKPYGGPHDIGIVSVDLSKTVFNHTETEPYNLNITVKLVNYGVYDEIFNLNVTLIGTSISNQTTITLGLRNSTTVNFTWSTMGIPKGNHTIIVNAIPVSGETDTTDNSYTINFTVTIKGDVNGDKKVDGKDISQIIKHYGKYYCHPHWHSNVEVRNTDINRDDRIDGKDVSIAIKKFGEYDP